MLSPFAAAPRPPEVTGTTGPPAADGKCSVRGDTAADSDGGLLVCAPTSRALSYQLVWRAAG
jgi:hypothetical protein